MFSTQSINLVLVKTSWNKSVVQTPTTYFKNHLGSSLETRDLESFHKQRNLYTNLLRTIISSIVNKNYYYIVILFLYYVVPFASKGIAFPLHVEGSLDSKFERFFFKKNFPKIFQSILYRMDKFNSFLSTALLLFDVLTILIQHSVLFFTILSQKS